MTREAEQTLLSGILGDGHIRRPKGIAGNSLFQTNCIYEDYINLKANYLKEFNPHIGVVEKNGYAQKRIFTLRTRVHKDITEMYNMSIEQVVNDLDSLGLALWFYDDGSLHKNRHFYNLNTHAFDVEIQEDIFLPKLKMFGMIGTITSETKKDGRFFNYIMIKRKDGANLISELLREHSVESYAYKLWPELNEYYWREVASDPKFKNVYSGVFTREVLKRIDNHNRMGTLLD